MESSVRGKSLRSKHYFQGGYDYDFVDFESHRSRFECPICLLCQRDPHQTSCGHRFCYSCIITWLNEGRTCPKDNSSLGEGDIFPDAMAHREILQLSVRCPFRERGCQGVTNLSDADSHAENCSYKENTARERIGFSRMESQTCGSCGEVVDTEQEEDENKTRKHPQMQQQTQSQQSQLICPNQEVACPYASAGCNDRVVRKDLQGHVQGQTQKHLQLISDRLSKMAQLQRTEVALETGTSEDSGSCLTRTYSGSTLQSTQKLLKDLFARVVQLEQKNCQLEIEGRRTEGLMREMKLKSDQKTTRDLGRYCGGNYLWRITNFAEQHEQMRHSHSYVLYSPSFYTSVFGYRLCLRCNVTIAQGNEEHLGLFIHVVRGENDDALRWPMQALITLTIVNVSGGDDFSETVVTARNLGSFDRPVNYDRNKTGFGFREFIRLNGLYSGGFLNTEDGDGSTLVIKTKVAIIEDEV